MFKPPYLINRSNNAISKRRESKYTRKQPEYRIPTRVPKAAAWGWHRYPICIKTLFPAVFFVIVAFTTPFWAYVADFGEEVATFGLWHHCSQEQHCSSIHDNLVEGRDVPAWYFFIQGTYFIGVATSIFSLTILTSNLEGFKLKMSVTVHRAVCCFLAISIFQQFVSLHTFISYFDEMDFLHAPGDTMEFYGSFYAAAAALAFSIAAALMVYIDEDLVPGGWKTEKNNQPYYTTNFEPMQVYKVHVR